MNARIKWRQALLSGEFKQTRGELRSNDNYCCLGVACEVFRRETGKGEWISVGSSYSFVVDNFVQKYILPEPVVQWLGYDDCNPLLEGKSASYWNDFEEANFSEIAELIHDELGEA